MQSLRYVGHVRPRDEHDSADPGDFIPAVAGGIQDSQHIVLGEGETVFPENSGVVSFEVLRGSDDTHEHFFICAQITDIPFRMLGPHDSLNPEPV